MTLCVDTTIQNNITRNSARPSTLKPTLEQTWSVSDHSLRRYGYSRIMGHMGSPFGGRGGRRG